MHSLHRAQNDVKSIATCIKLGTGTPAIPEDTEFTKFEKNLQKEEQLGHESLTRVITRRLQTFTE